MTDFTGKWSAAPDGKRVKGTFEDKGRKKVAVQLQEEIKRSPAPTSQKNSLSDGPPIAL